MLIKAYVYVRRLKVIVSCMDYMFAFIVRYDIQLVLIWKLLLQFEYYVFFGKVLKMVTKLYIYYKKKLMYHCDFVMEYTFLSCIVVLN